MNENTQLPEPVESIPEKKSWFKRKKLPLIEVTAVEISRPIQIYMNAGEAVSMGFFFALGMTFFYAFLFAILFIGSVFFGVALSMPQ